jgi:hypothetical protein
VASFWQTVGGDSPGGGGRWTTASYLKGAVSQKFYQLLVRHLVLGHCIVAVITALNIRHCFAMRVERQGLPTKIIIPAYVLDSQLKYACEKVMKKTN